MDAVIPSSDKEILATETASKASKPWSVRVVEAWFPCVFVLALVSLPVACFVSDKITFASFVPLWLFLVVLAGALWCAVNRGRWEVAFGLQFFFGAYCGLGLLSEDQRTYAAVCILLPLLPIALTLLPSTRRWYAVFPRKEPQGCAFHIAAFMLLAGVILIFSIPLSMTHEGEVRDWESGGIGKCIGQPPVLIGTPLELLPTTGEVPYKREIEANDSLFDAAQRDFRAAFKDCRSGIAFGEAVTLGEIAGVYGYDPEKDNAFTRVKRLNSAGISYLLLDVTFNCSGNNQEHRFLIFRSSGKGDSEQYEKVLDFKWEDGWSHPDWYVAEDGLYIAAWISNADGTRTYQRTYRVICNGHPFQPGGVLPHYIRVP